jgi:hypothetical protein
MPFQNYQWASGFGNTEAFVNVEDDVTKYRNKPLIVSGRARFDDGILRTRADLLRYLTGLKSFTWTVPVMSIAQYEYIQTNYTVGGNSFSGRMTIKTRISDDTYADFNAILYLPKQPELTRTRTGDAFQNVTLTFVNAESV